MKTEVLELNNYSLQLASKYINAGELVAFPTETVYGLGANALNEDAVKKIFIAKGRPSDNPLIVHISDKSMIDSIAYPLNSDSQKIVDCLMPGSITIVLNKKPSISDFVTAGLSTVAVRMPKSVQAREFIDACKVPIAAPSANLSSRPSPTTAMDVYEDMNGRIPLILRGDDCAVGIESTVLDLSRDYPLILRPGIVTASEISKVLGKEVKVLTDTKSKVNSPGVRYKHYAPSCPVALEIEDNIDRVNVLYEKLLKEKQNPVILCIDKFVSAFANKNVVSLGSDDVDVAKNIFMELRACEKHYTYIIEVFCPQNEVGYSVMNRMTKSAGGNILHD